MDVEMIYADKTEFRQYKWENFKTNCGNLRTAIAKEFARANEDEANLVADMSRTPADGTNRNWAGSEAERLLKLDVDAGRHLSMAPKVLRSTREEYQEWPLKKFRDHITQEVRSRKTQAYWLHRIPGASANEPWPKIDSL